MAAGGGESEDLSVLLESIDYTQTCGATVTYKSLDDHDDIPELTSHWWPYDSRYTMCGLSVRDKILNPNPSCRECATVMRDHERYIAQLEAPDEINLDPNDRDSLDDDDGAA